MLTASDRATRASDPPRFRFDAATGITSTGGLNATFTRAAATLDTSGNPVGSGTPRYDRPMVMPTIVTPYKVTSPAITNAATIWASGVDADGATELMVVFDENYQRIFVFHGGGLSYNDTGLNSVTMSHDAHCLGLSSPSEYVLPVTNPPQGDIFIVPRASAVFHGAVIVSGMVVKKNTSHTPSDYDIVGWGFALSQDQGATWQYQWDDSSETAQLNLARGRYWMVRVAPVFQTDIEHPLECFVVSTDYRFQYSGSDLCEGVEPNDLIHPQGGRLYLFRISREDSGSAWVRDEVAYVDVPPLDGSPDIEGGIEGYGHAHSAHAVEYSTSGLQVYVSMGDTQANSRIVRYVVPDKSDYADTSTWTTYDSWHGRRKVLDSGATYKLGSLSSQPVGVAWGPIVATQRTLIWSSDIKSEWLMEVEMPGELVQESSFHHLYGFATGFGFLTEQDDENQPIPYNRLLPDLFLINQPRVERSDAAMTVVLNDEGSGGGTDSYPIISRVLYCPSVQTPTLWYQVASTFGTSLGTSAIYGGYVYFTSFGENGGGLQRVPIPTDGTQFQPILAASGGANLLIENPYIETDGTAGSITALTKTSGVWYDGSIAVTPDVPSLGDKMFKYVSTTGLTSSTDVFAATIRLSSQSGTSWNQFSWNTDARVRRIRLWALDGSFGRAGYSPSITPNKTAQLSAQPFNIAEDSAGPPLQYSCGDRWCPITICSAMTIIPYAPPGTGGAPGVVLRSNQYATDYRDDNYVYVIPDCAMDGQGSFPYPIPPRSPTGTPTIYPNENLTVTSLNLGTTSTSKWNLRVGGAIPIGNWDQYAFRADPTSGTEPLDNRIWPLLTLYANTNNFLELRANCITRSYEVRVRANGSDSILTPSSADPIKQLWLTDSPIYFVIASHGSGNFAIGLSVGGGRVARLGSDMSATFGVSVSYWSAHPATFTQLRFRGANGEVNEMRWMGGEADSSPGLTPYSNTTILDAFSDLTFMKG